MSTAISQIKTNMFRNFAENASPEQNEQLKKNIREVVGQTFFGTLFKQMRAEMNPDNPFNGGKMAQTFQTQLDQTLISRWAESSKLQFADRIAQEWMGMKEKIQERYQ